MMLPLEPQMPTGPKGEKRPADVIGFETTVTFTLPLWM